jgi:hypothetical protein
MSIEVVESNGLLCGRNGEVYDFMFCYKEWFGEINAINRDLIPMKLFVDKAKELLPGQKFRIHDVNISIVPSEYCILVTATCVVYKY